MRVPVWIITSKTRAEMEFAPATATATSFTNELLGEAGRITSKFCETNFQERDDTTPPFRYDSRTVGGIWEGRINPETGREWNTCEEASELPAENLPAVVISPQGYPASAPTLEEKQEIMRVLRHWPGNVVLALEWHY